MAPRPPSCIGPLLASLPPPRSSLLSKRMRVMKIMTQLGPSDQTIACGRSIRSPCDRMASTKRRWKWMVPKAKPYLSKANAYGGSSSDEGGKSAFTSGSRLPSTRPPAVLVASAHAQGTGRRTGHSSVVPRTPELPLENACLKCFFKRHFQLLHYCQKQKALRKPASPCTDTFLLLCCSSPRPSLLLLYSCHAGLVSGHP